MTRCWERARARAPYETVRQAHRHTNTRRLLVSHPPRPVRVSLIYVVLFFMNKTADLNFGFLIGLLHDIRFRRTLVVTTSHLLSKAVLCAMAAASRLTFLPPTTSSLPTAAKPQNIRALPSGLSLLEAGCRIVQMALLFVGLGCNLFVYVFRSYVSYK